MTLDATHDPAVRSWVDSANAEGCDFPVQNLPFGRFRDGDDPDWRIGVAIGDQVLDLRRAGIINHADINRLIRLRPEVRRALRQALHAALAEGSAQAPRLRQALLPLDRVQLGVPCQIGDCTDFEIGVQHAATVGRRLRADQAPSGNKRLPIGGHGRASRIVPSGQALHRPVGQIRGAEDQPPLLQPSRQLDFALALAVVIGRPSALGQPITIDDAEDHVVGLTLFNNWCAHDLQAREDQPLGPFLSTGFASTISPWIVTLDALAPFRRAFVRLAGDPDPLPCLDSAANRALGAFDITLDMELHTRAMREAGLPAARIGRSNFADAACWTLAQLVAHHTVNGCALANGDLFATGTLSGPQPGQAGSLLEATDGGRRPITLPGGEQRSVLQDGDEVRLRGVCARAGFRSIGFGPCVGMVLPARG